MSKTKPKPGEPGGAPFKTPGKSTSKTRGKGASKLVPNQTIVALRGELKQLTADLEAIAAGEGGSTFAKGDKAKFKARIAALKSILAELET